MDQTIMKLFVYGTLRPGWWNNYLLDGCQHLGTMRINGASLYSYGGFPFAVLHEDGGTVVGDVYDINEDTLRRCDHLEGYHGPDNRARNFYDRVLVTCYDDTGTSVDAWVYINPRQEDTTRYPIITTGNWAHREETHGY